MVSFSFIFYSLPFSPMLWFSHSGDSFLLTNHFWKFLFSHLFFFSCCLLLLLLFFPSRVFCSLFFSFGFSCFVLFLVFCYFIPNAFFSHSRFPHHLLSCFVVVSYFLPISSPTVFFSNPLPCSCSSLCLLSLSQVLRLRLFAFLLFPIVFLLSLILFF